MLYVISILDLRFTISFPFHSALSLSLLGQLPLNLQCSVKIPSISHARPFELFTSPCIPKVALHKGRPPSNSLPKGPKISFLSALHFHLCFTLPLAKRKFLFRGKKEDANADGTDMLLRCFSPLFFSNARNAEM